MIETEVPTKWKNDKDCPFYYQCNSWSRRQSIPWNDEYKRVMRPGQCVGCRTHTITITHTHDVIACNAHVSGEWIYKQSQIIDELKTKLKETEDRARAAEEKVVEAEVRVAEAEMRVTEVEARVTKAENRAVQAEVRIKTELKSKVNRVDVPTRCNPKTGSSLIPHIIDLS